MLVHCFYDECSSRGEETKPVVDLVSGSFRVDSVTDAGAPTTDLPIACRLAAAILVYLLVHVLE